ncbi:MAG TPA: choice-of-anchor Q domain-containing protein, partial [Tepidisphaeraceae bacterium]|nr:choice-of-anchor Q domain-containing protein [Tepidisphaeraceae bacterium]
MRKSNSARNRRNRWHNGAFREVERLESRVLLSTTWMVTSTADITPQNPAPFPGMLRYAVNAAQPGDVIQFDPSHFQPLSQPYLIQLEADQPLVLANNVTIKGLGPSIIGVSGSNHSSNQGTVFIVNPGVTAEIDGLLITNGFQELGNAAGIDNEGTLALNNCAVTNCSTPQNGGGIFNNGTLTLTTTTVSGNRAANGAGIYNQAGSVTLNGCTVSSNTSQAGRGAGLYNAGTLLVTNSTFSGNSVDNSSTPPIGAGGAIWNGGPQANIYSSTFSGNSALNGVGAGIFSSGTRLNLFNSTFSGNTAGGQGRGGALNADGYVLGVNCTMVNNSASFGGAIDVGDAGAGDLTLYNTIVAQNTAASSANGKDIYGTLDEDYLNPFGFNMPVGPQFSSNNLIDDASSAGGLFTNDGYGNIVGSPALVGSLANNGGPTQTVNLLSGSPAIDAGSNSLAEDFSTSTPTALPTDQRGLSRIYNNVVDIGAIEIQPPPVPTGLVATPQADEIDLSWPATPGAATYTIYRGFAPGAESPTPLASNVTGTSFVDTGVTAGVTFYYTIVASNGLLTSAPSAEASATPTLPVLNAAQIGDTITFSNDADKLHIDWSTATANGRMLINDPHGLTINGDGNNDILVLNQSPYAFNVALPLVTHLNGTFTIKNLWNLTYTNGTEQL